MKYCVVIIDGAAGRPLPEKGGKTCFEIANIPHLDALAKEGIFGQARTVPHGMEPSSACACMSVMGYDPTVYYRGRSAIEAKSVGVPTGDDDVLFRCNLVTVRDGIMSSYSAGYISTEEARHIMEDLDEKFGPEGVHFYTGTGYRHICKITGKQDALLAKCTPPHDISDKPIAGYLPQGKGSDILRDLMERSKALLKNNKANRQREARGEMPATMIWLFWGSGKIPSMPSYKEVYGVDAAMTSGVDLLRGLAKMAGMKVLEIPGVTDGPDNDYAAQAAGALHALEEHDFVVIHVEAPDEAGHAGSIESKVTAIEKIDREIIGKLRFWNSGGLRIMAMPDHPTPIEIRTHTEDPVPFVIWGPGLKPSGASAYTEAEAIKTGELVEKGHTLVNRLINGS
jgi:2,3-bisphosphoglycerate-independent phosphoglycerate mutase